MGSTFQGAHVFVAFLRARFALPPMIACFAKMAITILMVVVQRQE